MRIPSRLSYARRAATKANPRRRRKRSTQTTSRAIDAISISYRLRRSARARRLRLAVHPSGVEVVAPTGVREAEIAAFVEHNRAWIRTKLGALRRLLAAHPGSARLIDGGRLLYRGRAVELRIAAGARARPQVRESDAIEVTIPGVLATAEREAAVERTLRRWLIERARADAGAYVDCHGPPHDLLPTSVRIKEQKHLWGSCSVKGTINLNWRLILAPPAVFEYVVVHELCHLRVPNHQAAFWRLVGQVLPDFAEHRHWLRRNGHLLTLRPADLR
ncbi:MAG TPA: SprT family zinc-dependent metalloprotease [Geminicoccaceae bacterium]|nr:SprT family zinc-dependent metalloprotease [Geminicoccaceae bacterium]